MTVSAYRVKRQADGTLARRFVVSTPDYASMLRWLTRTRGQRRHAARTLWLEEPDKPAAALRGNGTRRWSWRARQGQ